MNNKITVSRLTAMLAISTGKQQRLCEEFIKEFFQLVADELAAGESVRIKGFGTFKLIDVDSRKSVNISTGEENNIPGYKKIAFTPSKELAMIANRPFEDFTTVEISDSLSNEELLMLDEYNPEGELGLSEYAEIHVGGFEHNDPQGSSAEKTADVSEDADVFADRMEMGSDEESAAEEATAEAYADAIAPPVLESNEISLPEYETEPAAGKSKFIWGFLVGFVFTFLIGGIMFFLWGDTLFGNKFTEGEVVSESNAMGERSFGALAADSTSREILSAENVDASSLPDNNEAVFDTVSRTRYLTTIAREHYGDFNLWPVIYEENDDILGHPDRIRPGTKVRVPALSKYHIDRNNPDDIKKIKEKGKEIYSRFK